MSRTPTKPELNLKIKQLETKVKELQKEKNTLIEHIRKENLNLENVVIELTSNQWNDLIVKFITTISKKSGVLNVQNNLIDWLDIKPSVYHKRILSKLKQLNELDNLTLEQTIISKILCLKLFKSAYEDDEFHMLWRMLCK
jgi:hypothetical protein